MVVNKLCAKLAVIIGKPNFLQLLTVVNLAGGTLDVPLQPLTLAFHCM